ncbi:MAG: prepilin peptidase [Clostridia bacterium]|nr:prepilin peptidase [Clostridia bacterium]
MELFFFFLFGLLVGSFLNVCIYRIPRGESIVWPPSHCALCGVKLKPIDLVPLAGFLLLRGRCRYCQGKISGRYPLVELLTGALFALIFHMYGGQPALVTLLFLTALLLVISFIDIDYYRIPNSLIIFGFVGGIVFQIFASFVPVKDAFLGLFVGGGLLFLIALCSRGGMGGGDIKLAALIGFFLGWRMILMVLFGAAFFASLVGLMLIAGKRKTRKDPIPFGPFLGIGAFLALVWGEQLMGLYLGYFW